MHYNELKEFQCHTYSMKNKAMVITFLLLFEFVFIFRYYIVNNV